MKTYVVELLGGGVVAKDIIDGDDSTLGVLGSGEVGLALLAGNLGREGDELALVVPLGVLDGGGVAASGGQRHFLVVVGLVAVRCVKKKKKEEVDGKEKKRRNCPFLFVMNSIRDCFFSCRCRPSETDLTVTPRKPTRVHDRMFLQEKRAPPARSNS